MVIILYITQVMMILIDQNDPVMMGLLKSTMFPLQQVLEGEKIFCFLLILNLGLRIV